MWDSRYLCKGTKVRVFRSLVLPVLLYSSETWTLDARLGQRLDAFVTSSLRRILGYRWVDRVSNKAVLRKATMRSATCTIRERQLRYFGHVARFPGDDPAYRILSAPGPAGWVRPRGGQRGSWLKQICGFLERGYGPVTAREKARRRPREYSNLVRDAAKCHCGACPPT